MLKTHPKIGRNGFTLIELIVGVAILAVLTSLALPAFRSMMRNTEVRNAAASIQNGLQIARAEAVKRNANVSFVMGLDSSWFVTTNALDPAATIENRSSKEGSSSVTIQVTPIGANTVTFNSLGNTFNPLTQITRVDLSSMGADRDLRVVVDLGGSTKMCDPGLPSSNYLGCPP